MLVFGLVVLGLALRGMSSEERVRFGKAIIAGIRFIRNSITKPPSGGESFYAALKVRTKWAIVTPSIVGAYAVVFLWLVIGSGDLSDPRTLVDGGLWHAAGRRAARHRMQCRLDLLCRRRAVE